jgi:hypothetical protein
MTTIPRLSYLMTTLLTTTADHLACSTGFVKRVSPLSGSRFARTLIFSWWQNPAATCQTRADMAAALGCPVSAQAIDKRFTPSTALFMRSLLAEAIRAKVSADPVAVPVLKRFTAVEVCDSSVVALPHTLSTEWRGCGNASQPQTAALKLTMRFDLTGGRLCGPLLTNARTHDQRAACELARTNPLPQGALHIGDLAFFVLNQFAEWDRQGKYWLSRFKGGTAIAGPDGVRWKVDEWLSIHCSHYSQRVDTPILLGAHHRLPVRLIAERVPAHVVKERRTKMQAEAKHEGRTVSAQEWSLAEWTLLVTNCSYDQLSVEEALALEQARWQIELLIKRWKSLGQIDEWRSGKPWRILCEVYTKLLIMVLQHWLLVVGSWSKPDRSMWKGLQAVQRRGWALARGWVRGNTEWLAALLEVNAAVGRCRIDKRRTELSTYQILLAAPPPTIPHILLLSHSHLA